jgi:long-chain acyl-CoA synthetase
MKISSHMSKKSMEKEAEIYTQLKKTFSINSNVISCDQILVIASQKYPDNIALISGNIQITYKDLYAKSVAVSKKMQAFSIKPEDRILLYYENSIEFYIAYFAAWQIGAVIVPVNIFLHTKELAHIINDSQPSLIIASQTLRENLEALINQNILDSLPATCGPELFEDSLSDTSNFIPHYRKDTALAALLYTSGTTGVPKGVMLTSKNIMTNTLQCYARFTSCGLSSKERFFCILPLFHVFAQNTCLWLPFLTGSSVIVVKKIDRKLILEGLLAKPTLFLGFPALFGLLCLMKNAPLDSVKLFISGADMLPDKIRSAFALIYGRRICAGYGLTESAPLVSVNYENNHQETEVVGYPVPELLCEIRDTHGNVLPPGKIGTLWLKGDNITSGYYNAPEATSAILIDGWLDTGDLATLDDNGRLAVRGRLKDVIIHKGFNIYPAEIENILLSHPAVFKAAVIGQSEDASGQVPIAFVAVRYKDAQLEELLHNHCINHLAFYKLPRKIVCLDDLPMNATGKIDKKQLTRLLD